MELAKLPVDDATSYIMMISHKEATSHSRAARMLTTPKEESLSFISSSGWSAVLGFGSAISSRVG
jgi:hypothetical protein